MPAAPARLSITICWFHVLVSFGLNRRTSTSSAPPGVDGTTTRIGRLGKSALRTGKAHAAANAATANFNGNLMEPLLSSSLTTWVSDGYLATFALSRLFVETRAPAFLGVDDRPV